jgi:hypothetical protein
VADAEVDRGVELRVVELLDHVGADDPGLRRAERDERGDVERAHADHAHVAAVAGKAQRTAALVVKRRFGHDAGARHHRQRLVEDAALGHGKRERGRR